MDLESGLKAIHALSKQHKSLVEKTKVLFADIDAHSESVLHHLAKIKSKLGIKSAEHMCGICLENKINFIVTPCNHVYCEPCATKCKTQRHCFVCRSTVRNIQKIFILD